MEQVAHLEPARNSWSLEEISFHSIDRARIQNDEFLLYTIAAGSFIEFASDLYTRNLAIFLSDDPRAVAWLTGRWESEEVQHGRGLRRYVEAVWPDFPWMEAYNRFFAEYSRLCSVDQLASSPALEMAARCVVETGTATYYQMLSRTADEPVLRDLAAKISSDEVRHYKYFYSFFKSYREKERAGTFAIARNLWHRLGEIRDEDVSIAFNAAYSARHPNLKNGAAKYREFRAYQSALARDHFPFEMAAKMLAKPLAISPISTRLASPLFIMAIRRLMS